MFLWTSTCQLLGSQLNSFILTPMDQSFLINELKNQLRSKSYNIIVTLHTYWQTQTNAQELTNLCLYNLEIDVANKESLIYFYNTLFLKWMYLTMKQWKIHLLMQYSVLETDVSNNGCLNPKHPSTISYSLQNMESHANATRITSCP